MNPLPNFLPFWAVSLPQNPEFWGYVAAVIFALFWAFIMVSFFRGCRRREREDEAIPTNQAPRSWPQPWDDDSEE